MAWLTAAVAAFTSLPSVPSNPMIPPPWENLNIWWGTTCVMPPWAIFVGACGAGWGAGCGTGWGAGWGANCGAGWGAGWGCCPCGGAIGCGIAPNPALMGATPVICIPLFWAISCSWLSTALWLMFSAMVPEGAPCLACSPSSSPACLAWANRAAICSSWG